MHQAAASLALATDHIERLHHLHLLEVLRQSHGGLPSWQVLEHADDLHHLLADVVLLVHETDEALAHHLEHVVYLEAVLLADGFQATACLRRDLRAYYAVIIHGCLLIVCKLFANSWQIVRE
jgi:hypothetical protein